MPVTPLALVVLVVLLVLVVMLRELRYRRFAKTVDAVRRMLVFDEKEVSLSRPLDAELGRLRIVAVSGRRSYRSLTEFTSSAKLLLGSIRYRDLCSGGYLLAIDSAGNGYLDSPAVKISVKPFENVLILCLDPSEVPKVAKSVEIVEESSTAKSVIDVVDGKYSAKISWVSHELPSWRLVYDSRRGSYRIVKEPRVGVRAKSVRTEVCAKSSDYFAPEVCATIARLAKVDSEVSGALEGLADRKIVAIHKVYVSLLDVARELGVARYPHISGYSSGYVRVRLAMEIPLTKDVIEEELV